MFGCRAFVHIPKDEKSKLDDKAKQQWIFLGYDYVHEEFGYRLWDPVPPPTVHDDHGGDEPEAQDDATNDEAPVNDNFDQQAQAEQVPPAPPPN